MDVSQWWEFANQILPKSAEHGYDVPDQAYDALRDRFYLERIAPELGKQGISPAASRGTFMKATERPGKSAYPTLELAGASALAGLAGPLAMATGTTKEMKDMVTTKRKEAELQGIGPIKQGIAELGGELVGSAPYYMMGTGLSGAVSSAAKLGKTAAKLMEVPVMGMVQGAYDAAKADEGHRISEGLAGFALGTGVGALVEAKPLWRVLTERHGISQEVAQAVEQASRGVGNDVTQELSNSVMNVMPEMKTTVEEWVKGAVQHGRKLGNPMIPAEVTPKGKLWMHMQGADGKTYNLTGLGDKQLANVIGRVGQHLENGGQILGINGDTDVLHAFYKQLDGVLGLKPAEDVAKAAAATVGAPPQVVNMLKMNPSDELEKLGGSMEVSQEGVRVTLGKSTKVFDSMEEAEKYADDLANAPASAPSLIDETHIAPGIPPARGTPNMNRPPKPPNIFNVPPPMDLGPRAPIKGGAEMFSFFVRPFYSWVDTVAKKHQLPGLYEAMKNIDNAMSQDGLEMSRITGYLSDKSVDFSSAQKARMLAFAKAPVEERFAVGEKLKISFAEQTAVFDAFKEIPQLERALRHKAKPFGDEEGVLEHFDYVLKHGDMDRAGEDFFSVAHSIASGDSRWRNVEPYLRDAQKLIDEKVDETAYLLGDLRPLFQRHMEFMRGHSDRSQKVVDSVVNATIGSINSMIGKVNKNLPSNMQLGQFNADASDALGRFVLFSYAGSMGARPVSAIRDGMQLFMTTYPMLGEKYTMRGLNKAFGNKINKRDLDIPDKYGALVHHRELQNLYAGGPEGLSKGPVTKLAEASLKHMEIMNNANRVVSFWGHSEKALDAIHMYRDDATKFLKESGLVYADDGAQQMFLTKLGQVSTEPQFKDLAYQIGKEMTDLSQWNYKRGAHPGVYKYALGRLMGQYGTWPMNYWEYARRLTTRGDTADKVAASTRLGVAHSGVLWAGHETGVDTASWAFQGPAIYSGSPLMEKLTSLPTALDTQSQRGAEARRKLLKTPEQVIPTGTQFMDMYRAFATNDKDSWKTFMGFNPMSEKDAEKGLNVMF